MPLVIACIVIFTGLISLLAFIGQRNTLSPTFHQKPWLYTLSLGGYASAWAFSGAFIFAQHGGYLYLALFFGISFVFLLSPLFIRPLLKLTQTYKLSSLADVFSFRYCSQSAGVFVTLGILIAALPLMAVQIAVINDAAQLMTATQAQHYSASTTQLVLCAAIICFTLFATRKTSHRYHRGLVFSLAIQSLFKLVLFLLLAFVTIYMVFGSFEQLEYWLIGQPKKLALLNSSLLSNDSRMLMLVFFSTTLIMPHTFHLMFNENPSETPVNNTSWGFPFYLLLLSLPTLPILWAVERLPQNIDGHLSFMALAYILESPWLSAIIFCALLAAIISSLSVMAYACASMCLNHLVWPFYKRRDTLLFKLFLLRKKVLAAVIIISAFVWHFLLDNFYSIDIFTHAAYIAAFQFLPGLLAVFYWPTANRIGLLSGLSVGFICWFITIILPAITPNALGLNPFLENIFNLNDNNYALMSAAFCLGLNMLTFGFFSFFSRSDEEQKLLARICSQDELSRPKRQRLAAQNVDAFIQNLSDSLGNTFSQQQVSEALAMLNMQSDEHRPFALRLLRRQIESNLSGLFGPTVARKIVTKDLPYIEAIDAGEDIQLIEHRLEADENNFTGLAAELDRLRRYHRNTIRKLPIGICSIDSGKEVFQWNNALAELTHISSDAALGAHISDLCEPWYSLINDFIESDKQHIFKTSVEINNQTLWLTLHKNSSEVISSDTVRHQTLVIEDVSSLALLEKEQLHNERLASIGRLAAGVAHEIGNPVTGIACLAQNLKYDIETNAVAETAKDILTQTDRITRIVQSLVNFSHVGNRHSLEQEQYEALKPHLCADDAIHLLALNDQDVRQMIDNQIDQSLTIQADTQAILQVFINLIKNALQAIPEHDGTIILRSEQHQNHITLSVSDNGCGIAANIQENIFEPFFTTKEVGEGTGLGLAWVYNIIEEHNGQIKLLSPINANSENPGSCFSIELPLVQAALEEKP